MTAVLATPYGAVFAGAFCLASVTASVTLAAAWDRLTTRARRYYAPTGRHRR